MKNKTLIEKRKEVKKKIENILNKYYMEYGKEIISPIFVYKLLNKKFNYKMVVEWKEVGELTNGK